MNFTFSRWWTPILRSLQAFVRVSRISSEKANSDLEVSRVPSRPHLEI